ncbi:MAG TPA: hypothetical protein P5572_17785, partial [Phycisphaerae bacterium]|nr:hypothetical protein [Phycisphaerae bacterium]
MKGALSNQADQEAASPRATDDAPASRPEPELSRPSRWERLLTHRRLPLIVAFIAVVLALPALTVGLEADDYFLRVNLLKMEQFPDLVSPGWDIFAFSYGEPERVHRLMDAGIAPWWSFPDLKLAFCRPLSSISHWLDFQLWPDSMPLMHAHSLLWFALFVAGAAVFYRRTMGLTVVAGLAALLFALDDGHANPAGWIAGRNTLLAATFGIWCLAAHDAWRRSQWRWGAVIAPLLFVLALLSAEAGVATLAYLVPYALFLERGNFKRRAAGLAPYLVLLVCWRIVWAARGYGVEGAGLYIDPLGSPLHFAQAVITIAPILLMGQWALPPSDLYAFYDVINTHLAPIVWAVAVIFLGFAALVMRPVLRGEPLAKFWATGMLLSLLPICAMAGFPMDRLLLFVSIGAIGLLAMFLQRVWRARKAPRGERPRWWRCTAALAMVF